LCSNLANHEEAILLTAEKDFGELVFRQGTVAPGIVLVRLAGLSPMIKAEIVAAAIINHEGALFAVIMPEWCENPAESFL
jgi:predicted nuclease of predicted toxin-antitoxin system